MTAIATAPPQSSPTVRFTPDDLLHADDAGLYELVGGRLVEKRMASESNWIAGRITYFLTAYLIASGAGEVLPEQTFQCFPEDPDQIRRPDVSVLVAARVPEPWPAGHLPFRPDVAVEVLSPNDSAIEFEVKLEDYRSAGVPAVWVVIPDTRLIRVHPLGGPILELRDGDVLGGDPVLPGFAVEVTKLLPRSRARPA